MKNKIAIVGHGLVPSIVSERLLERMQEESDKMTKTQDNVFLYEKAPVVYYDYGLTKKQMNQVVVPIRTEPKYQNNEPCPCGSGNKYKKCCKKM